MLAKTNIENILFLDIETVPENENWAELSDETKALFEAKTQYQRKELYTAEEYYNRAGIWAEFGKIICISVGYFSNQKEENNFRITSFYGDNEKEILIEFKNLLNKHFNKDYHVLCAHNGKEFDFPYMARRMIINSIPLPNKLLLFGKKPWEIPHLDTMDLWKFGDYKHYTSLNLLTNILGIPSPKQDINGSQVAEVYYEEKNIKRIVEYCEADTIAIAQIILKFKNKPLLVKGNITKI